MDNKLTLSEQRFLDKYLKSMTTKTEVNRLICYAGYFFLLLGGFLIVYTIFTHMDCLTDRTIKWVFLPMTFLGLIVLVVGAFLLQLYNRNRNLTKTRVRVCVRNSSKRPIRKLLHRVIKPEQDFYTCCQDVMSSN